MKAMKLYKMCLEISKELPIEESEGTEIITSNGTNDIVPLELSRPEDFISRHFYSGIFYISDIHLAHKVAKKFEGSATDNQVKQYIKKIAKGLFTNEFKKSIERSEPPIVIFGGDISSSFMLAEIFYSEFIKQWDEFEQKSFFFKNTNQEKYIYAILGNHELWDFETLEECSTTYRKLFNSLGIVFLENTITWFGTHRHPVKKIENPGGKSKYIELKKQDDEEDFNKQLRYIHNTMIVGGVGFAGNNVEFNANNGIYRGALDRNQEIEETRKWQETYIKALEISRETNNMLIVLTHNPVSDWSPASSTSQAPGQALYAGCIYLNGHTHRNSLYHDDDKNTHIFANNQIGYHNPNVQFKKAYIYNRVNPFARYEDGYHEITSADYLRFYDYMQEYISGNGQVERLRKSQGAKFYMVKHDSYYGFFLVSKKGTYICNGGNIRKIDSSTNIEQFNDDFPVMVRQYIKALSPYRKAQEQISKAVKEIGGDGSIHGCIVDIDFLNHIMLNPADGKLTYYYSPELGKLEIHKSLESLLKKRNKALANKLAKIQLEEGTTEVEKAGLTLISESAEENQDMIEVNVADSVYVVSNRMNRLQRLFSKKILRDWNDDLLVEQPNTAIIEEKALPPK